MAPVEVGLGPPIQVWAGEIEKGGSSMAGPQASELQHDVGSQASGETYTLSTFRDFTMPSSTTMENLLSWQFPKTPPMNHLVTNQFPSQRSQ